MVLLKMNNHEHRTKQTYESYTFQLLMSFWIGSNENIFGAKLNKGIMHNQKSSHSAGYISKTSMNFQKYGEHKAHKAISRGLVAPAAWCPRFRCWPAKPPMVTYPAVQFG